MLLLVSVTRLVVLVNLMELEQLIHLVLVVLVQDERLIVLLITFVQVVVLSMKILQQVALEVLRECFLVFHLCLRHRNTLELHLYNICIHVYNHYNKYNHDIQETKIRLHDVKELHFDLALHQMEHVRYDLLVWVDLLELESIVLWMLVWRLVSHLCLKHKNIL